jgi:hypothetical protein
MAANLDSIFFRLHTRFSRSLAAVLSARVRPLPANQPPAKMSPSSPPPSPLPPPSSQARRVVEWALVLVTVVAFSAFAILHTQHVL